MASRRYLMVVAVLSGFGVLLPAAPTQAQSLRELISACGGDYKRFCSDTRPGDGRVVQCLSMHSSELSGSCRSVIRDKAAASKVAPDVDVEIIRDVVYGPHRKHRFDVYRPAAARNAPVILMVHGGAWRFGDKEKRGEVDNKMRHWVSRGAVFISTNYRLVPEARAIAQARDVARVLAFAQSKAREWGGDPKKFALIGHSSGAHLVSLLTSAPNMAYRLGASTWLGTIALDSAATDVVTIMEGWHFRFYDRAFGDDPGYWRRASPLHRLTNEAMPTLFVCSTRRKRPCDHAQAYAAKAGSKVKVMPVAMSHNEINDDLGTPGNYTAEVDAFLEQIGVLEK